MRKLDRNQKRGVVSLLIFAAFLIAFFVFSNLVQSDVLPSIELSQRLQGVLSFVLCLPLICSMFFFGKYFKSERKNRIGNNLLFVSIALLIVGIIQVLLSLVGFYG